READPRADVFAFGAILYEMLSGQRAFSRASRIETAFAVLNEEPAPLPPAVPRSIERIVRRCLAKDPAARYASGAELEGALVAAVPRRRRRLLLDVGLLLLAIGITLALSTSPALTGTLRWSGERLTVTSELVDTGTQLVLSARDADVERKEAGALATILLRRASEMLELELRPEANRAIGPGGDPVPGAFEFYL